VVRCNYNLGSKTLMELTLRSCRKKTPLGGVSKTSPGVPVTEPRCIEIIRAPIELS